MWNEGDGRFLGLSQMEDPRDGCADSEQLLVVASDTVSVGKAWSGEGGVGRGQCTTGNGHKWTAWVPI